jgi:hypothetical protein
MVLRTRTWLPLRGYLALRGVGGTSTRRLKRIGWRLDLTKPQHTTPTYSLHPLLQLLMQLTDYPDSPNLLGMSGTGVHCHHGSLWA